MGGVRVGLRFLRMLDASCVQRGALTKSSDASDVFSLGSCMSGGLSADGSQFMGMCTQIGLEEGARVRATRDAREMYEHMVAAMEKKAIPNPYQLQELIRATSTATEVALAMDAASRVRRELMLETGKDEAHHTKEVTHMMVAACLRGGDTQSALKLLWKKHPDGFTTSIGSANLLLKHAKVHKDVKFMRHVLRVMAANDVQPTQTTADIIIRLCKESGEIPLMFSLAKEYHNAGLTFHDSLFDVLISNAANIGDPNLVHEIQTWRVKQGLQHTTASAVSITKALILERKPKEAATIINDHCPASDAAKMEKRERYLSIMVKVWPLQLLTSLNVDQSREEYLRKLKDDVVAMFDILTEFGLTFQSFNVGENFAQGKGSSSVAQKEVKCQVVEKQNVESREECSLHV